MSASVIDMSPAAATNAFGRLRDWLWLVAAAAMLALAYAPLLWEFCVNQWARPHYQYFPFVVGAFAWLLWRNFQAARSLGAERSCENRLVTIGVFATAWLCLAIAHYAHSPWLAVISAILLVAGGFRQISRQWHVRYLWGIWAMLWLIVPLPLGRDQQLINWLQHVSSRLSSTLLDVASVAHLMDGNALLLPDKQFFVDEACSGIVSVMSVVACAVIFGIWRNRPPAHVALLAATGVGWATLMNVVRITTIAIVFNKLGWDWSSGTAHEILGLTIFAFIFLALVSTDLLLLGLLAPIEPAWAQITASPIRLGRLGVKVWDRLFAVRESEQERVPEATCRRGILPLVLARPRFVPISAFGLLAVLQFAAFREITDAAPVAGRGTEASLQRALACDAQSLPVEIGQLRRVNFLAQTRDRDDVLGNFSRTYEYRDRNGRVYVVSCDFPYPAGWHELTVCYRGLGWELHERRVAAQDAAPRGRGWPRVEAEFSKPDGSYGYLVAGAFDYNGQPVELPTHSLLADLARVFDRTQPRGDRSVIQVQVWTTAARGIDDQERQAARELLLAARQRFHEMIVAPDEQARSPSAAAQQEPPATADFVSANN